MLMLAGGPPGADVPTEMAVPLRGHGAMGVFWMSRTAAKPKSRWASECTRMPHLRTSLSPHAAAPGPLTVSRDIETRAPLYTSTMEGNPSVFGTSVSGARMMVASIPAPMMVRFFEMDICSL